MQAIAYAFLLSVTVVLLAMLSLLFDIKLFGELLGNSLLRSLELRNVGILDNRVGNDS